MPALSQALKERWRPAAMAHLQSKGSREAIISCALHGQMWARCPLSLKLPFASKLPPAASPGGR